MNNEVLLQVKQFLKNADLSNYEINVLIELLRASNLTARELSERSEVPTGRIYEILKQGFRKLLKKFPQIMLWC